MDDTEAIYSVANSLLLQLIAVLHSTIVTSEQLCHPSTLIPSSTIGKHLRHIHDHFRLLLDAMLLQQRRTLSLTSASSTAVPSDSHIADDQPPISFSYDTRSRNLPSETIHAAALESFVSLAKRLEVETEMGRKVNRNEKLILKAVIPYEVAVETTAAREVSPHIYGKVAAVSK